MYELCVLFFWTFCFLSSSQLTTSSSLYLFYFSFCVLLLITFSIKVLFSLLLGNQTVTISPFFTGFHDNKSACRSQYHIFLIYSKNKFNIVEEIHWCLAENLYKIWKHVQHKSMLDKILFTRILTNTLG